jgi:TPP-dependent pyruvate/acetoin dehydrogenase alpha subunit
VASLAVRAASYAMPGVSVDGMDVLAVYGAAREALDRARSGQGPSIVEARAYRYRPNTSNDDDTRYRSREEVEEWRARDPLARLRAHLLEQGTLTLTGMETLEREVADEVAEAAAWAEAQPEAEPADVLLHTWADRPVSPLAWMTSA